MKAKTGDISPGITWDRNVDESMALGSDLPEGGRARMAQQGIHSAIQDSSHPASVAIKVRVADREDPSAHRV
jgi:hypothetical protein